MPKRGQRLSDEQKAKMKAGRDKKQTEVEQLAEQPVEQPVEQPAAAKRIEVPEELLKTLIAEIEELKKQKNPNMTPDAALATTATMQGYDINVGNNGVQGRIFKYPVEKSYYPDPTQRLYDEPTLSRYNLRENFHFDWEVEGVEYEKYNVTYAEPRFTIRLFRKIFDEEGKLTGQLALVNRAVVHEDEIVARIGAEKLGLQDKFKDFQDMMNEMRYYRFRSWLLDLFTPAKVEQHNRQSRQMVIDGKVVEMFDTEVIIDKESAESKSSTIESQVRV